MAKSIPDTRPLEETGDAVQAVTDTMNFVLALGAMPTTARWSELNRYWVAPTFPGRYRWDADFVLRSASDIIHAPIEFFGGLNHHEREGFILAARRYAEDRRIEEEAA